MTNHMNDPLMMPKVNEKGVFPLLELPSELKRRTAAFLSARDALQFAHSCKMLYENLSFSTLPSRAIFQSVDIAGDTRTGDEPLQIQRIPVPSRRIHSIRVSFRWKDQGWGNRKGQVWIIGSKRNNNMTKQQSDDEQHDSSDDQDMQDMDTTATNNSQPAPSTAPFGGGRIVYTSEIAPHEEQDLTFTISPLDDEEYHLWVKAGGGGGHSLMLARGTVHPILIYDDVHRIFSLNYQALVSAGVLRENYPQRMPTQRIHLAPRSVIIVYQVESRTSFYPKLLLSVCKALRQKLVTLNHSPMMNGGKKNGCHNEYDAVVGDDLTAALFTEYNIPISETSLKAIEELVQGDIDEDQKELDFRAKLSSQYDQTAHGQHPRVGRIALRHPAGVEIRIHPGFAAAP